jgi:alpha-ketoglutarate-dependent taurine dioxygenase
MVFSSMAPHEGEPAVNEEDRCKAVRHPLVRVHPETGRKLLYFDQGKI